MTTKELLQLYLDARDLFDARGWPVWDVYDSIIGLSAWQLSPPTNGATEGEPRSCPGREWVAQGHDGLIARRMISEDTALYVLRNHVQEPVDKSASVDVYPDAGQWGVDWSQRPDRLIIHLATHDPDGDPVYTIWGTEWFSGPGAKDKAYLWAWRWMDADAEDAIDDATSRSEDDTNDAGSTVNA